jgi:hypothetical protein
MLSGLELTIFAAAILIGVTGAWSPCGFSMVETLGPTGHSGGRRTTFAACAAFALGAPLGGAATFGAVAGIGEIVHGADDRLAYLLAASIALAAAIGEAKGVPIVPQIRRQLPERWRWLMPMPVAGFLYGILLGLGFTTFVLSLGVWALAGISFALGELEAGLLAGIGFGIGRLLPVVAVAPIIDRPLGIRIAAAMSERPGIYYGFRLGDSVALVALAAILAVSVPADPAGGQGQPKLAPLAITYRAATVMDGVSDPVASRGGLVVQRADQVGLIRRGRRFRRLPGTDPAIGGPWVAVLRPGSVRILRRNDLRRVAAIKTPGVREVAVSPYWLAWLEAERGGGNAIRARIIKNPRVPGPIVTVASAGPGAYLSRPSLSGERLVFLRANRRLSAIKLFDLARGRGQTLISSPSSSFAAPTLAGQRLLFVRTTRRRQELRLKTLGTRSSQVLFARRRRAATFWSTALTPRRAYLTVLRFDRSGQSRGRLLAVRR